MNRKFNSLKEVSDCAHGLIRDQREKELKALNPSELLEWFIASQRFVAKKAVEIINDAGIKVENQSLNINVACFYFDNYYGGYCGKRQIIVGTQKMFTSSYNQLISTIIHEVTHLEIMDHSDNFWQRCLEILKIEGFAELGLSVEDAFVKDTLSVYRHPTEKIPLLHGSFIPEISAGNNLCEQCDNFLRKYHQIRRNPIFGRDNWCNIRRLNDMDFKDDIIRLCKLYEVNYNRIYRLSHDGISKPDFMGIDNRWNPYAY